MNPILLGAKKILLVREVDGFTFPVEVRVAPQYMEALLIVDYNFFNKKTATINEQADYSTIAIEPFKNSQEELFTRISHSIDNYLRISVVNGEIKFAHSLYNNPLNIYRKRYVHALTMEGILPLIRKPMTSAFLSEEYQRIYGTEIARNTVLLKVDALCEHLVLKFKIDRSSDKLHQVSSVSLLHYSAKGEFCVVEKGDQAVLDFVQWLVESHQEDAHTLIGLIKEGACAVA